MCGNRHNHIYTVSFKEWFIQTDKMFFMSFCGHRTLPWPCTLDITGRTTDWLSPPAITKAEHLMLGWWKRSGCQTSSLFTPSVLSFMTPPWKTSCSGSIQMETFFTASGTTWSHFFWNQMFLRAVKLAIALRHFPLVFKDFTKKVNKTFSALYFEVNFGAQDILSKYEKSVIIYLPSCHSKTVRLPFSVKLIFWRISLRSFPYHNSS